MGPVGYDWSLGVDGDDGGFKHVLAADHEALYLAVGSYALHLLAYIQQVVFDVLEHVDLGDNELADAVRLLRESVELYLLELDQVWPNGSSLYMVYLLYL